MAAAIRELGQWVKEGKIKYAEEVVEGLERAPEYLNMLFTGTCVVCTHTATPSRRTSSFSAWCPWAQVQTRAS
jgi:hypothetical protein